MTDENPMTPTPAKSDVAKPPRCLLCLAVMTMHPNGNFWECPNHFTGHRPARCDYTVLPAAPVVAPDAAAGYAVVLSEDERAHLMKLVTNRIAEVNASIARVGMAGFEDAGETFQPLRGRLAEIFAKISTAALNVGAGEVARLMEAVKWYEDEARALATTENLSAKLAVITVLANDGGARARAALATAGATGRTGEDGRTR